MTTSKKPKQNKPRSTVKKSNERVTVALSSDDKNEMLKRAKLGNYKTLTDYILDKCLNDQGQSSTEAQIRLEYTARLLERAEAELTELKLRYDELNRMYFYASMPWYKKLGKIKELPNR